MGRFGEMVAAYALLTGCGGEVTVGVDAGPQPPEAEAWSRCPGVSYPAKPPEVGSCPGGVPTGALTQDEAEQIFARTIHEAGHILEIVEEGESAGPFDIESDRIVGALDVGWVDGRVAREADGACVSLILSCWTGGHGGFGASALDGEMDILLEREFTSVRGTLGLSEGGALVGAPEAAVHARIDDGAASGSVGSFEF